jgi:hypothetical protein
MASSNSSRLNSTSDILQRYVTNPRNAGQHNAKLREMDSWQFILRMGASDNPIQPYPLSYFGQVAINAVDKAWNSGLKTLEERDARVMKALAEREIEYENLLRRALKFAHRELPMGLVPAKHHAALIAEAVHDAIEERWLPYIFADGRIRKFYDILWPQIQRKLADAINCECDPIDERRLIRWLTHFKIGRMAAKKTNSSGLIHESLEANTRRKR